MDTLFPDVSEFQSHVDFNKLRTATAAVAVRVSYGARLDKTMPQRRDQVRNANFTAVIWYLFLRATQPLQSQVDTVVGVLGDLRPGEAIAVDWESDGGSLPTSAQRDTACLLFQAHYGQPTVVYAGPSALSAYPPKGPAWVAAYGQSEPRTSHAIWQYTNGQITSGSYKPVSWPSIGVCDTNVFHGSAAELAALINPRKKHVPAVYGPAQEYNNVDLVRQEITTEPLGNDGNGYVDTHIPFDKLTGFFAFGPSPDRDGGYDSPNWPDARVTYNNTDGQARLVVENGKPNTPFTVVTWRVA